MFVYKSQLEFCIMYKEVSSCTFLVFFQYIFYSLEITLSLADQVQKETKHNDVNLHY